MAREIQEIQDEMINAKENKASLVELQSRTTTTNFFSRIWEYIFKNKRSTSKVAIWRLWIYIISFSHWKQENLYDEHRLEIEKILREDTRGRTAWYRQMALKFQYGHQLVPKTDFYNNDGVSLDKIAATKIIKYAAVTEVKTNNSTLLIIKIATEQNGVLTPVNEHQLASFRSYIDEIKFAGVKINIINYTPDRLRIHMRVVRDPLLIDENGLEILTARYPVNDAIFSFLKELPFDGKLSLQKLEEKILAIKGINDLSLDLAETAWIDPDKNKYGDWEKVDINKIPVSGYFKINLNENNEYKSTINYL